MPNKPAPDQYKLVMISARSIKDIPSQAKQTVIVSKIAKMFHIRIFDECGTLVVDATEASDKDKKDKDQSTKKLSPGKLEKRYKELIAIGIAIHINCESCMEWHINEALKSGSKKEEIIEEINELRQKHKEAIKQAKVFHLG